MKEIKHKLALSALVVSVTTILVIVLLEQENGLGQAQAEITKDTSAIEGFDYKVFVYGKNPKDILSKTDADYEITGYPPMTVVINNWDKLTLLEQQTITSGLATNGFFVQVG